MAACDPFGTVSQVLTNIDSISDLAAEFMTVLMICEMFSTAPLFGGNSDFFDMKKYPPDLLCEFVLLLYDENLCTTNIMSLV